MTEQELVATAYEAVKRLEYLSEYRADPEAELFADIILGLLGWRDNAINCFPELDRTQA